MAAARGIMQPWQPSASSSMRSCRSAAASKFVSRMGDHLSISTRKTCPAAGSGRTWLPATWPWSVPKRLPELSAIGDGASRFAVDPPESQQQLWHVRGRVAADASGFPAPSLCRLPARGDGAGLSLGLMRQAPTGDFPLARALRLRNHPPTDLLGVRTRWK